MHIYGAGLAGLLAGAIFPNAQLFEAAPYNTNQHRALLRFRTNEVGKALGIDFRPVTVRKGIWYQEAFHQPEIRLANFYAKKVTGQTIDRSIWDLTTTTRYIAPENLIEQMVERCGARISWNCPITPALLDASNPAISTIPMMTMARIIGTVADQPEFQYLPISVRRFRIQCADVYQTVYYPDPSTSLYRVSITGNLVIAEYMGEPDHSYPFHRPFGLHQGDMECLDFSQKRLGKIAPIDDNWRKRFIYNLSIKNNIFSLGRYSTWRNILLDDVLNDIVVIRGLMNANTYERAKHYGN